MGLVVVRCPACRGASRVEPEALGETVACPRCHEPFLALEEVPIVVPVERRARERSPLAPPEPLPPLTPPAPRLDADERAAEPGPDHEHDPHTPHAAGLPVSVLIGLSLLPFGVPLLWAVAPVLTGFEPALSIAVPIALAISASALSLGVVYTIDWRAMTRVKGVLVLVGLSYLTGAGLFFLKQQLLEQLQRAFDTGPQWRDHSFEGDGAAFRVRLPDRPVAEVQVPDPLPLPDTAQSGCARASFLARANDLHSYVVGWGRAEAKAKFDADWIDRVSDKLSRANDAANSVRPVQLEPRPGTSAGYQWKFARDGKTLFARVYVGGGRVYYLAVLTPNPDPDGEFVDQFFKSFRVSAP